MNPKRPVFSYLAVILATFIGSWCILPQYRFKELISAVIALVCFFVWWIVRLKR